MGAMRRGAFCATPARKYCPSVSIWCLVQSFAVHPYAGFATPRQNQATREESKVSRNNDVLPLPQSRTLSTREAGPAALTFMNLLRRIAHSHVLEGTTSNIWNEGGTINWLTTTMEVHARNLDMSEGAKLQIHKIVPPRKQNKGVRKVSIITLYLSLGPAI